MVKSFVCLRNICRVMKLPVVLDADRLELELETELLGSLLTILLGALRVKNAATFAAFAVVVSASNGLDGAQILGSGTEAEAEAEGEAEAEADADAAEAEMEAEADGTGAAALKAMKGSAGLAVVAGGTDASKVVALVARRGAVAGKSKSVDAADDGAGASILKRKRSAGAAVAASVPDASKIVLPVATGAGAGKRKRGVDAAGENGAGAAGAHRPGVAPGRVAKKRKMKYINIPKVNSTFQ